jgi:hypothetical protein
MNELPDFTEDDIDNCWTHHKTYLVWILNGKYPLEEAKDDLRSLIGSVYDPRCKEGQNK